MLLDIGVYDRAVDLRVFLCIDGEDVVCPLATVNMVEIIISVYDNVRESVDKKKGGGGDGGFIA